jgi:hypothetical protein
MNINRLVKLEISRSVSQSTGEKLFYLVATYEDGSKTAWGDHRTERGIRRMLTVYANRMHLTKKSTDLAEAA